jgi:hypothetical protein
MPTALGGHIIFSATNMSCLRYLREILEFRGLNMSFRRRTTLLLNLMCHNPLIILVCWIKISPVGTKYR